MPKIAYFRFYEELNDFLPPDKKKITFPYEFTGNPSIKDAIEAIGVPHTEVDLILVNGESVTFTYQLHDGDMVSVYPVFESLDISNVTYLREAPLREPKFILNSNLGKLAKYLRMLGFDTYYENNCNDSEIIALSEAQTRTILTKSSSILKNKNVTRGYWIRSQDPREQVMEVITRFDLSSKISPFSRCMVCNGIVDEITKESIEEQLEPKTKQYYHEFFRCTSCGKIYWKGSHYERMKHFVENVRKKVISS